MNEFIKKVKECFKDAFVATIPVFSGYIVMGISFGVLAVSKGYSILYVLLMSVGIYAGSMQFVTIDLLVNDAALVAAFIMTLFINLRHLFYGISVLTKYKNFRFFKNYCIFALTDETFSLVCSERNLDRDYENAYCFTVSILDHMYWISGSLIGALLARFIPATIKGLDFSMTALFVVIVVSQWEKQKNHVPTIIGLLVSFFCLIVFGTKVFIIPSMILMTAELLLMRRTIIKKGSIL